MSGSPVAALKEASRNIEGRRIPFQSRENAVSTDLNRISDVSREEPNSENESEYGEHLERIAQKCDQMSGRLLRKLPLKAYSAVVSVEPNLFITGMLAFSASKPLHQFKAKICGGSQSGSSYSMDAEQPNEIASSQRRSVSLMDFLTAMEQLTDHECIKNIDE